MKSFYKDNRIVPVGIMLLTLIIFFYHFELDRPDPQEELEIPAQKVPTTFIVETSQQKSSDNDLTELQDEVAEVKTASDVVPSTAPSANPKVSSDSLQQSEGLTTDDVVLMFKTGATVLWKRVPIHMATSFSANRIKPENIQIYSDHSETIGQWEIIDILANSSDKVRQSETFQPYLQQEDYEARQNYAEMSNMPGDAAGPPGGWKLAGETKIAKWYIFMEDDSYIFLPNLLRHLENFDHQKSWYLGSLAWIHGDYFAHGGSGFALSRGAWEKSFGKDPDIIEKFEAFTEAHGCGDHILGHVLHEYGIQFGETVDESRFKYGFNPEAHWSTWFEPANWCKPVYSWHHTHGQDVARFYKWWDNWSSKYEIKSSVAAEAQPPSTVESAEVWRTAWESVDACEAACVSWAECVQWSFYEDRCKMDSMILLGNGIPEGDSRRQTSLPWVSGWMPRRVENWGCQS
ncbi:hypothetical protein N7495_008245 [Penicillium taxi]|uniref:uncharacterized protein n=1 Tax=Penicillium taxi TaxID=168475 RepID=UPI0025458A1E|nr:uncharacterized protein N7495_008245 [Penicillium taxi]KAJ5888204.1 hypothetical protein N7495_008245 [Penicillium taxi]